MKEHAFAILRSLISGALVVIAFLNLWHFTQNLSILKARKDDAVVVWENRLIGVRDALLKVHYLGGDVGYITAGVLQGSPRTTGENTNWVQARYVMIPWNLLQDTLAAPYVIADFSGSEAPPELPAGFVMLYDSRDGLVLLQRTPPQ